MRLTSYSDSVQSRPTSKLMSGAIFSPHGQRRGDQSARQLVDNLDQTTERTNAVAMWQPRHGVRTLSMIPCLQWGILNEKDNRDCDNLSGADVFSGYGPGTHR